MTRSRSYLSLLFVGAFGCEPEVDDETWLGLQPGETDGETDGETTEGETTDGETDGETTGGEPESGPLRIILGGEGSFVDGTLNGFGGGSFDGLIVSIHIDATSSHYEWKRYHGANKNESIRDLDVDASGRICGSGWTNSTNLATTTGAVQTSFGGGTRDLYLGCWSPTGALLYSSYFGGRLAELNATALSLADDGGLVVTGSTNSINLKTTVGAVQPVAAAGNDGLVFEFGASGSPIEWGSYLGGSGVDSIGLASDLGPAGEVWMIGNSTSADFPVTDGSSLGGSQDSVVARVSAEGSTLELATLLGGSADDFGEVVVALPDGTAVTCGNSYSDDFPTTPGAFQTAHVAQPDDPHFDVVVTRLAADGSVLAATYLGGAGFDACLFLDVDDEANVYIGGWTDEMSSFPLTTFDSPFGGFVPNGQVGFLAKFDPELESLEYAVRTDIARGMDVLDDGRVVYLAATDPGLAETPNAIAGESGNALIVYAQDGVTTEYLGYVMGEGMIVEALHAIEL
ncbi:hypothetical protein ACNOYE_17075 [Nannocystaceae bacterium ST9]